MAGTLTITSPSNSGSNFYNLTIYYGEMIISGTCSIPEEDVGGYLNIEQKIYMHIADKNQDSNLGQFEHSLGKLNTWTLSGGVYKKTFSWNTTIGDGYWTYKPSYDTWSDVKNTGDCYLNFSWDGISSYDTPDDILIKARLTNNTVTGSFSNLNPSTSGSTIEKGDSIALSARFICYSPGGTTIPPRFYDYYFTTSYSSSSSGGGSTIGSALKVSGSNFTSFVDGSTKFRYDLTKTITIPSSISYSPVYVTLYARENSSSDNIVTSAIFKFNITEPEPDIPAPKITYTTQSSSYQCYCCKL